ncbi:endonuclease [Helicobacter pylori]|nr:endonuclease [Helicobacter pylori]WRC51986.1 endonuclease [Helicobacter pylori]
MFGLSLADIILERFKDFMREQPEPYKFYMFFMRKKKNAF